MAVIGWLLGLGLLAFVVFGLATGRLDRRAEGCCPADPAKDLRMRPAVEPLGGDATVADVPDLGARQAAAGSLAASAAASAAGVGLSVTAARTAPAAAMAAEPTRPAE